MSRSKINLKTSGAYNKSSNEESEIKMKINREKVLELAGKPDAELWGEILKIARSHGISLPEKTPSHEDLEKLRGAVTGARFNMGDAIKILDQFRKRG